jgi:hypothetical protein
MKIPKRFALSTLLLLMLVAALVFGYAQWRRQKLEQEVRQLKAQGATIRVAEGWFWPTPLNDALITVPKNPDGTYQIGVEKASIGEAKQHYRAVAARIRAMGVESIKIFIDAPPLVDGMMMSHYVSANDWLE